MAAMGRALVCSPVVPTFDRESGNQRIWNMLTFLREGGWEVALLAKQGTSADSRYCQLLHRQGIPTFIEPGAEFESIVSGGRFDIVVLCFWFIGELWGSIVRTASPSTRVLVDSIDLHFVRNARGLARGGRDDSSRILDPKFGDLLVRELNVYIAADAVLTVSQKEADLVNDLIGDERLAHVLPDVEPLDLSPLPVDRRRGLLFIGNFKHPPNVEAAEYLLHDILPELPPSLLKRHPLSIVGNGLDGAIANLAKGFEHVRMVGWVPSVLPYLERARVSLVPLLHGAGTKRKTIQSLMVGTPVVSTAVGCEGLPVENERDVLVAGDVNTFVRSVERVVEDDDLWCRLAASGRNRIAPLHGLDAGRKRLDEVLTAVLARPVKSSHLAQAGRKLFSKSVRQESEEYDALKGRVRAAIEDLVPTGSIVSVVSKGDDELLSVATCNAQHFPCTDTGLYAGHHPADSEEALEMLAGARARGAEFLAVPWTSLWWLDYYKGFRKFLEGRCPPAKRQEGCCLIFDIRGISMAAKGSAADFV